MTVDRCESLVTQTFIQMSSSRLLLAVCAAVYGRWEMCTNRLSWQFSSNKADQKRRMGPHFWAPHIWPNTEKKRSFSIIYCVSSSRPQNVGAEKGRNETVAYLNVRTILEQNCALEKGLRKNNTCDVTNRDFNLMVSRWKIAKVADFNKSIIVWVWKLFQ